MAFRDDDYVCDTLENDHRGKLEKVRQKRHLIKKGTLVQITGPPFNVFFNYISYSEPRNTWQIWQKVNIIIPLKRIWLGIRPKNGRKYCVITLKIMIMDGVRKSRPEMGRRQAPSAYYERFLIKKVKEKLPCWLINQLRVCVSVHQHQFTIVLNN